MTKTTGKNGEAKERVKDQVEKCFSMLSGDEERDKELSMTWRRAVKGRKDQPACS
jgi:hypothetical protein